MNTIGERGQYLFHYTTLPTALEHILPDRTFRMSPFSQMRDPRESQAWLGTGGGWGDIDDKLYWEFYARLNRVKDRCKLFSLTQDDPRQRPPNEEI